MGGFRYNGCGVADHFKNIKSLGMHSCPSCKRLTEFTLDEVNQKIDVFWIPTLTLKSRYAVMCKKCKNGEFCSVEWAGYLLNHLVRQDIIFESDAQAKGWSPATRSFQEEIPQESAPAQEQPKQNASSDAGAVACPNCGNRQDAGSKFCFKCGQKLAAEPPMEKNCPYCGAKAKDGMPFCTECGTKLV